MPLFTILLDVGYRSFTFCRTPRDWRRYPILNPARALYVVNTGSDLHVQGKVLHSQGWILIQNPRVETLKSTLGF